jgi:CreA protein
MKKSLSAVFVVFAIGLSSMAAHAEVLGKVDTAWNLIKDHSIQVEAFDDPKVDGVTCYVSRAMTGGIMGAMGLATNTSDASIACRQTGPIKVLTPLPKQEEAFTQRSSVLFKRLRVVRMVDAKRHTLVYLTYSDKLIDGSPKNAVTAVTVPKSVPLPMAR